MRESRPPGWLGGPLARGLATLCAAGLVLAAPTTAFADTPAAASGSGPNTPSALTTSPQPVNPAGNACGGGTPGWIGRTTALSDGTSDVRLSAFADGQPATGLQVGFHLWDTTAGESRDSSAGSWPTSQVVPSGGGTGQAYVGRALADGHQYGWNAWSFAGDVKSPVTADCAFNVDLTPPTQASIAPSTVFPPLGSGAKPTGHAGDTGVTVRVTSRETVPGGCAGGTCVAGGVREFQYALDDNTAGGTSVPASFAADGTAYADVPISVGALDWGSHMLYVRAVDTAGNSEPQASTYSFYAPARAAGPAVPGDVDLDGVADYLAPAADGSLTLFRGGADGTLVTPEKASPANRSPRQDDWNNYLVAHRGAVVGGGDSLFAYHKSEKQLFVYANDANFTDGVPGHFTQSSTQLGNGGGCGKGLDNTWNHVAQMKAVQVGSGRTGLVMIEQGHLRYYPAENACYIGAGVELGVAGDDWSGFTLMSPGVVNGVPTLWVRDTVTGAVAGLPLPVDAVGKPVTGFTPLALPAHKRLEWWGSGGTRCVDIDHGWTGNGTAALVWTCSQQGEAANQQFTWGADGSLHVLGKCLDVTGGATANESPVNLWDCNGSPAQKWTYGPHPHTLKNPNADKCLDAALGTDPGRRLIISDCGKNGTQEWTYPPAQAVLPLGLAGPAFPTVDAPGDLNADGYPDLVATVSDGRLVRFAGTAPVGNQPNFAAPQDIPLDRSTGFSVNSVYNPGRCLDNYGAPAGGSLRFYDCWGGTTQKFAFGADGTLRSGDRCVTVRDNSTAWGAQAVFADCQATAGQIWKYRADGTFYNPAAGACLELPGWNDANGTVLGIWGCNGNPNQRWTLSPNAA
ncbi:ricin-type beta-trefoil lectin domain protein [Kitasatospora sp. NPDC008115]|uniref:ricin-type beta-trefoil lectin domain protein n=1 Tax=Kitasatospora sp. NPDC008115 TaxID=3364022 RepID=UPI0036F088EA